MATIELLDPVFYKNGKDGASVVVGYEGGERRAVRYTITAPDVGAQSVNLTLHTAGRGGGEQAKHIPLRFFIGTDPGSHANAGYDAEYTGQLMLEDDWLTFTGKADILLLPGQTYYLWVFPGEDTFGWYSWQRNGYVSTMETEGATFILPTATGGLWRKIMLHATVGGKWFLIAPCAVKDSKWHYIGPPV